MLKVLDKEHFLFKNITRCQDKMISFPSHPPPGPSQTDTTSLPVSPAAKTSSKVTECFTRWQYSLPPQEDCLERNLSKTKMDLLYYTLLIYLYS